MYKTAVDINTWLYLWKPIIVLYQQTNELSRDVKKYHHYYIFQIFVGGTNLYTYPSICFSLQFCWWWRNGVEQFQKLIFFPSCHNIIILCKYSAISIVYILPLRIHGLKNIHRIFLWATSRTWCDIPLHHISISSHSYMRAIVAYLVFRNLCWWRW